MTFKGFNIKYPEYEVLTPQTKLSFTLRSLTVQEEENLKGSFITAAKMSDHLNKTIFDSIVKKPDHIKDYDSFLRSITIKDREALLYGLYHITYEDVRNYEVVCPACDKQYAITLKMSEAFNISPYPKDDILTSRKTFELSRTPGVFVTIKQPTIFEEVTFMKQMMGNPMRNLDSLTDILIIDKFEQNIDSQVSPVEYVEKDDILDAYLSLPAKDRKDIFQAYMDNYGQYGIDLKVKSTCVACSTDTIHNIDLAGNFFRALHSIR